MAKENMLIKFENPNEIFDYLDRKFITWKVLAEDQHILALEKGGYRNKSYEFEVINKDNDFFLLEIK